ncbi:MAG: hypothetical protein Q8K64_07485 [Sediminibacterium sp.]|nr:hypothetical protein [Sediminibacterium sp.]
MTDKNSLFEININEVVLKITSINHDNKDIKLKDVFANQVKKTEPLRLRMPKSGVAKNVAEAIEEALRENGRPLSVKELYDAFITKGRELGNLKDFSSQLNSIGKAKSRFHKEKVNNRNYWGLSDWRNGTGKGFNMILAKSK